MDRCEAFFQLYHITENFKVTSASLYLTDNAAHWYEAFKQTAAFHSWEQFCEAIMKEFDVDVYRQKMKSPPASDCGVRELFSPLLYIHRDFCSLSTDLRDMNRIRRREASRAIKINSRTPPVR